MFLSEKGKYFFDYEMKEEYNIELHYKIIEQFYGFKKKNQINYYIHNLNNIKFIFSKNYGEIEVSSTINQYKNNLIIYPIKLNIELNEDKKIEMDVFSINQFKNILNYYKVEFPTVNSLILTKELEDFIFEGNNEINIELNNIPLKEIFNEINEYKGCFGELSKYIELYMKTDLDMKDFPEKNYLKNEDFYIKKNEKLDYYNFIQSNRAKLWAKLDKIIKKDECFFFTGPHGIGKTFTLLGFLTFNNNKNFHYIYINLDILYKEKNYMNIIFYEARNLFESIEEFLSAFKYIQNNLKYPNFDDDGILLTIIQLIHYINEIKKNNHKYTFFIDQFKYINDENYDSYLMLEIKELIKEKSDMSLIVCSSLNYTGIKNNLINKIEKKNFFSKFNFEFYNESFIKQDNENDIEKEKKNENLNLFGKLPIYYQIENKITKKYINLNKKIIKKKLYKFYYKNNNNSKEIENIILNNLKWIKNNNNKILSQIEILKFIRDNPIKYFSIKNNNKSFDYLYPLIEIIIEEIIKTEELKKSCLLYFNIAHIGWHFEQMFFNKINNTNIFLNFYIDNIIQIKTIFKKEKIDNFDKRLNTLFHFSFSNVKRYDGVIYLAETESIIFIQASIYKTNKLEEYDTKNLSDDINKINNNFFKVNEINPKKYFLVFVLENNNYYGNNYNIKTLEKFNSFNFCYYNILKDELIYENKNLKEIDYQPFNFIEEEEENNGIIFFKNKNFEKLKDENIEYKPGYYYVEKGMDLFSFVSETCFEYENFLEEISKNKNFYSNYKLKNFFKSYFSVCHVEKLNNTHSESRIVIALKDSDLLFGNSIKIKNGDIKYQWQEWSNELLGSSKKMLNEKKEKELLEIPGFFVFEKKKKLNI